jgi:hypothetical protein
MLKLSSRPEPSSFKAGHQDYYREESCPIDGKVRPEPHTTLLTDAVGSVKDATLKCLFDSTDGVVTKRDWIWMAGIGLVGLIVMVSAKSVWVSANEAPMPVYPPQNRQK